METLNAHDLEPPLVSAPSSPNAGTNGRQDHSPSLSIHSSEEQNSNNPDVQGSTNSDASERSTNSDVHETALGIKNAENGSETIGTLHSPRSLCQELGEWKYEMLAALLFVSMAFAILGTAYPFQGKPRPQWPIHISINALLSVYAVIFKAALIFVVSSAASQTQWTWFSSTRPLSHVARYDDASRGLWGSLKWLWSPGFRQPLVALGAIVVVVGVAIEPFIQQFIHYTDCSSDITGDSSFAIIPRTNFYDIPMFGTSSLDVLFYYTSRPSTDVQTAVISGFLSPPLDVGFDCQTGNCTYGTAYSTVGFCSICQDLSSQLDISGGCSSVLTLLDSLAYYCNLTSTLPSGLSINAVTNFANYSSRDLVVANSIAADGLDKSNSGTWEIIVAKTSDLPATDPDTLVAYPDCADAATNNTWHCKGYGAASCSFRPCVRTSDGNNQLCMGHLKISITKQLQ